MTTVLTAQPDHNKIAYFGTVCTALILGFVAGMGLPKAPNPPIILPTPEREMRVEVYDCDNLAHAPLDVQHNLDHPAYYAFQRLQFACAQNQATLALMQIWENNPITGVVYEPAPQ